MQSMSLYFIHTYTGFLFLALCMVVFIVRRLVYYATNSRSNTSVLDNEHELEPVADWAEYGDYEVWVAARKMIGKCLS